MNDTKVKIELDSKQALTSVKDLQKALKATKDEMVGLEAGSDAFSQAANRAGELKHQIDEINQAVRGASSDFGDMVGNVAKAGAGITGAFQAAQGALSLFGVESENVTEAIAKMQSMMALTQGLAAIDEGIKSFRKFTTAVTSGSSKMKVALTSTGIGAIAIVLGSIIANWDEFTKAIGLSEEQMSKFGEVASGVMNVLKGSLKSLTLSITKLVTGDIKGAWETVKEGFDVKKLYAEGVTAHIDEIKAKAAEDAKAVMHARMEAMWEQYYADLESQEVKDMASAILDKLFGEDEGPTEHKSLLADFILPDEEEEEDIDEWIEEMKAKMNVIGEASDGTTKRFIKDWNTAAKSGMSAFSTFAGMAGDIFANLASLIGDESEKAFKAQKAFAISSAVANLAGGIVQALVNEPVNESAWAAAFAGTPAALGAPAYGWSVFAADALAMSTAAAAQIATISRTKFSDKQSAGSSRASVGAAANVSPAATALSSPVQYTQDVQGAEIAGSIRNTRVYVTETDITETQRKVDLAETESTF